MPAEPQVRHPEVLSDEWPDDQRHGSGIAPPPTSAVTILRLRRRTGSGALRRQRSRGGTASSFVDHGFDANDAISKLAIFESSARPTPP
jgi:hypothetical protein